MNFLRKSTRGGTTFDMTPMIDVVMQLLIFFMFTNQLAALVRSPVDLPEEKGEEATEVDKPSMVIDVRADGMLLVDSRAVSRSELGDLVRAEVARAGRPEDVRVLVRGDRSGPARYVNDVGRELVRQGVRSWKLGTQQPMGRPGGER